MEDSQPRSLGRRIIRWMALAILAVLLLSLTLSILIQIPYVQNIAITTIGKKMSRDLGTYVGIGHIRLNFFDDLLVDNLLILDQEGDTLLYSERAYFDLDEPLTGLLNNRLVMQEIDLNNSKCYLKTDASGLTNYQFLLDYLKRNTGDTPLPDDEGKTPFRIIFNPARITLNHIEFDHHNDWSGRYSRLKLDYASAQLEKIKPDDPLHFRDLSLIQPEFELEKFPPISNYDSTLITQSLTPDSASLKKASQPLSFTIDLFEVTNGKARVINKYKPVRSTLSSVIDFRDASAFDINLEFSEIDWYGAAGFFKMDQLQAKTPEGFTIVDMKAGEVEIDSHRIQLQELVLQTPNSLLRDHVQLSFEDMQDFKDFTNKVRLDLDLDNSYVGLKDILHFANQLNYNQFFVLNGGKQIDLIGRLRGTVNDLRGQQLDLQLADQGFLRGSFDLTNVTIPREARLNLDVSAAEIPITSLRQLIPNFNPPENYDKLGNLKFTGYFDGFFNDFVAFGDLHTDLGRLKMDMRLSTGEAGIREASYRGSMQLIDFDLARWTDSEKYGTASFTAEVTNGQGLSIENAYANLYAKLDSFHYQGYNYQNAILQGELNKSYFNGQLYINDPNVNLDFSGSIDFFDSIPAVDFVANVRHIDFFKLNLTPRPLTASGDIDFNFDYHDLFNLDGRALGYNVFIMDDTTVHELDTVRIISRLNDGLHKNLHVESDILNFDLIGGFDLENLPATVQYLIQKKHPRFSERLGFSKEISDSVVTSNDFTFAGTLDDSKGIQKLINADLGDFKEIRLDGFFTNDSSDHFTYDIDLFAPLLQLGRNRFDTLEMHLQGENELSSWQIDIGSVHLGKRSIYPVAFDGVLRSDSLQFQLASQNVAEVLKKVDMGGLFYLNDTLFQFDLANTSFEMLNEPWQIIPNNYLQLSEKYVRTENMVFLSDDSYLRVTSPGDNSLALEAEKIDLSFLDDFLVKDELHFSGDLYSVVRLENIFSKSELSLELRIDSIGVNGDSYGNLSAMAILDNIDSTGDVNLQIIDQDKSFVANGSVFLPLSKATRGMDPTYSFEINISDYPLKIGEYFIGHSISETTGTLNGDLVFQNEGTRPSIDGSVVLDGSLKIDYLGTSYAMREQEIDIGSTIFDFTGATIYDELGNTAEIQGGIIHDYFLAFGLDAIITSDKFQFLNTTKDDNSLYYGRGIGQGIVQFSGNFQQTNMRIRATTGENTRLNIPVEDDYSTSGDAFIKYVFEDDDSQTRDGAIDLRGINLNMQLNLTQQAEVQIIFDEFSGDIIKGRGDGNLTMTIERGGDFQMTGKYVIDQGQYLYTLLDFINKPFIIERGGIITWTGDPLDADLNMQARYTGLRVPPRNLIAEYLENGLNNSAADAADISTQVDLVLALQGILSQPEIDFDIQFPDIDPALKNITDSKLRILKEDVSELNRQVYGLLFFNSFLPPSINVDLTATTVNTLSEFITSQLSNYVAAYITQGVEEVDYISGVDFYFDYNFYRSEDFIQGQETGVRTGSEFALAPNIRFFDDRVAFSPGASIIEGTILQGSTFIGSDVKLDFFLTDDKRLKLSLFYKRFPSLGGSRNKLGLGFRFSKSYDSFGELFGKKPEQEATTSPEPFIQIKEEKGNE